MRTPGGLSTIYPQVLAQGQTGSLGLGDEPGCKLTHTPGRDQISPELGAWSGSAKIKEPLP